MNESHHHLWSELKQQAPRWPDRVEAKIHIPHIQCYSVKWASAQKGLTHWGWVMHICVSEIIIIGSDNGLSPGQRQAIIWTNAGILLTGPLATNFSETLIRIQTFSFKKMLLKMSSAKWRPFCLGLNVLRPIRWQWQPCNGSDEIRYW